MLFLDFAYTNRLASIHPFEKVFFSLGFMLIAMQRSSPMIALFVLLAMIILIIGINFPLGYFIRLFILSFGFIMLAVLPIMIDLGPYVEEKRGLLWSVKFFSYSFSISLASLRQAIAVFIKAFASLSCLYFLILTTSFSDIITLMKRLKFPALLLEFIVLIYRFFIIMLGTIHKISVSQKARLGYNSYFTSLHSIVKLIVALFSNSYKTMQNMFFALEARSYRGEFPFFAKDYSFSLLRVIALTCLLLFLSFV